MKDYRLSEIREICKNRNDCYNKCECIELCSAVGGHKELINFFDRLFDDLKIEPRDMIDLPCINIATVMDKVKLYEVHYRDKKTNAILTKTCKTEAEADEFLANLKEKNNE